MRRRPIDRTRGRAVVAAVLSALVVTTAVAPAARAESATGLRDAYALQARAQDAGYSPSADRGRRFFVATHGADWSCGTCHTADPRNAGRHATTGRSIGPLAPAANPLRFTDGRKVEKWFTRNCRDVVARECTPGEKADVLAWFASVR